MGNKMSDSRKQLLEYAQKELQGVRVPPAKDGCIVIMPGEVRTLEELKERMKEIAKKNDEIRARGRRL